MLKKYLSIFIVIVVLSSMITINVSAQTTWVSIAGKKPITVDTYNGVESLYRSTDFNDNTGQYSCAALVWKYYSTVYNVSVSNLYGYNSVPSLNGNGTLSLVSIPVSGDIAIMKIGTHSAIVKSVTSSNTVVLFEQNYKDGTRNLAPVNREIPISGAIYYHYSGNDNNKDMLDYKTTLFDPYFYYKLYPDLQKAYGYNIDALWNHWVECGIKEGRISSPLFDVGYYLNNNTDLKNAFKDDYMAAYKHFLNFGYKEKRKISPIMDIEWYFNNNPDVAKVCGLQGALIHAATFGMKEGRSTSSNFNPQNYAKRYIDLSNAYGTNDYTNYFRHYIWFGINEGRDAH